MKMTLIIQNFGQIKNIELDLNRIIILTDDGSYGANTLLKTIRFIRNIYCRKNDELEEFLKDMKAIGEAGRIGKKIDVEISHNCGDDRGVIGRALNEETGAYLREGSLIQLLINDKTVIKIDYNKTILKKLNKKDINECMFFKQPEINLLPGAYKEAVSEIGELLNSDIDIVISTHSEMILVALNNLITAGYLYKNKKVDKTKLEQIVPKNQAINPEKISAYFIENGELIDIIDKETKIISSDKLEQCFWNIYEQFDKLLELYPPDKNK